MGRSVIPVVRDCNDYFAYPDNVCYKSTMTDITTAIESLVQKHGGLRGASRAVGIDIAYLWRLKAGEKTNPSDEVLGKLGLTRQIRYRRKR